MGVRRVEDLIAWQLADQCRQAVVELTSRSHSARRALGYTNQLLGASSGAVVNIVEGFGRFNPGDFSRFLSYSIASLAETEAWLRDGISRGYFSQAECEPALRLKRRAWMACVRLRQSQLKYRKTKRSRGS